MLTNAERDDQDSQHYSRIDYGICIVLTLPFLLLALVVGLFEVVVRTDGKAAAWTARPFLWAVERGRPTVRRIARR